MQKTTSRARGEFPRLKISPETRAAFNGLLGEAPKLGLDPERVEAAGLPGLRALLALKQAAESRAGKMRDAHLDQLQSTLRLLQYRKHPELVQQLQARAMALQGRGGDTEIAHVTVGEIVLPKALQTRAVIEALGQAAGNAGIPLNRLRVGSGRNAVNPHTGQPEFFNPSDEEPMEEITVTAPRETGINNSALAVDEYGRSPEDIANPDFRRGQGEAVIGALPGMGIARAAGYGPRWQEGDGFIPTGGLEKGPNLLNMIHGGRYGEAALTGIGAAGDAALLGGAMRGGTQSAARGMIADLSANKPSDFLYSPNGTVDWGRINPGAVEAGAAQDLPIRVMRGSEKFGMEHIVTPERSQRINALGFSGPEDFLDYVAQNHNMILEQPGKDGIALVVSPGQGAKGNKGVHNFMAVTLSRDGDHYGLTSVMPDALDAYLKSGGKNQLWRQGAIPASQPR